MIKNDVAMTEDDKETAEVLCRGFQESFTKEEMIIDESHKETREDMGEDLKFDEEAVLKKLLKLKPDKSPGPDGIHPMLLRSCAYMLAKPLARIYNESLETGILPTEWKTAEIAPIFKKGNRNDPGN